MLNAIDDIQKNSGEKSDIEKARASLQTIFRVQSLFRMSLIM